MDLDQAYKLTFGTPEGKIVLEHIIHTSGFLKGTGPIGGKVDPLLMSYNEGRRDMCGSILAHIGARIDIDPSSLEVKKERKK